MRLRIAQSKNLQIEGANRSVAGICDGYDVQMFVLVSGFINSAAIIHCSFVIVSLCEKCSCACNLYAISFASGEGYLQL